MNTAFGAVGRKHFMRWLGLIFFGWGSFALSLRLSLLALSLGVLTLALLMSALALRPCSIAFSGRSLTLAVLSRRALVVLCQKGVFGGLWF